MYSRGCKREPPQRPLTVYWWFVCNFFTVRARCASASDRYNYITELCAHTVFLHFHNCKHLVSGRLFAGLLAHLQTSVLICRSWPAKHLPHQCLLLCVGTWGTHSPQIWAECGHATQDPFRQPLWHWDPHSFSPECLQWQGHKPESRSWLTVLSGIWTGGSVHTLSPSSPTGPTHQFRLPLSFPPSLLSLSASRILWFYFQLEFFRTSTPAAPQGGGAYDRLCSLHLQGVSWWHSSAWWAGPGLCVWTGKPGPDPGEPSRRQPAVVKKKTK